MKRLKFKTRVRRLQRYLGIALSRPLVGPLVVDLETTHHCNLQCSFCESHGSLQESSILKRKQYVGGKTVVDLGTVQRLAREMAHVGTDLVSLTGKGEPMMHPHMPEIVAAIKCAGIDCSIVTNGTLGTPDLARTLVEHRLDLLSVSLNAGCPDVFLRTNKRDYWDRVIRFLEDTLREREVAGADKPWVRITHVVTKENVDDMDNMVGICARLGVDEVLFNVMGELPETTHLQIENSDVEKMHIDLERWTGILGEAKVAHTLHLFIKDLEIRVRDRKTQDNPLQRKIPCYLGWTFSVIAPDGIVIPCCYCEDTILGNVTDHSFIDVWHGERYRSFRRASLSIPTSGEAICEECFTTCNRAIENMSIYNKLHPFNRIRV
jgi:MoaA/NifB/PqqE/SkfB family radical SAM enzyme